jgi:hypothetical protein
MHRFRSGDLAITTFYGFTSSPIADAARDPMASDLSIRDGAQQHRGIAVWEIPANPPGRCQLRV